LDAEFALKAFAAPKSQRHAIATGVEKIVLSGACELRTHSRFCEASIGRGAASARSLRG